MSTTATATAAAPHVLIFPYPAQGHMIPLLDLAHHLAARGFTLTVLTTPKNLPILGPLLSAHRSIQTLILPLPAHPSIPSGAENLKDMPLTSHCLFMYALGDFRDAVFRWFKSHPSPPVAIISDMFLGWTHSLALDLGIHRLVFSPSGAMALSVIYSLWREMPKRVDEDAVVSFPRIPKCPKYPWWQLSPTFRSYVEGEPVSEFVKEGFNGNMASWGLIFNSFTELDLVYLDHMRKELGRDRIWAVGPLLPKDIGPNERGGSSSVSIDKIMSWLDSQEDRSVLYVCFGSQTVLSNDVMNTIAIALEKSGVNFIWPVKEPTEEHIERRYGAIPQGFEARVADRGLVVKGWAPQVPILQHRAVGAFLTHCGWNSILEAIMAGVPMLTWPMGADQFVNADLLVNELKVATGVCEGIKSVPDPDKLGGVFKNSVSENGAGRDKAIELSKKAREAMEQGGSSLKDLEGLVNQLNELHLRHNCTKES